ncbi:uncharacterized protein LOC134543128 [Bacillus rossius redtenbacheri]|uniref:uncharacterized protein LOC134543128 n=1 Tax=Bacillus rossius redtenbacheri TaxID=93214 RepID=UPI002FDF0987
MDDKSVKIVPWFCTEEWDYVCKLVYSDDVKQQTKGFEHLLVWKARVPSLPASVTCTLELLQVRLQDQLLWQKVARGEASPHAEQELRLAYATVVMRFLNHLASLFQNMQSQTLYSVAKKLHIPEWVVKIRHDAAHDGSLPSVDVLRSAAGYALSWLHEYWWKPQALCLSDWKRADDDIDDNAVGDDVSHENLCNLLDLWQALKLYQEAHYGTVGRIPDTEVRAQVSVLYLKAKSNASGSEPIPDSDVEVTADSSCANGTSIRAALSLVLSHIKKSVGDVFSGSEWEHILLHKLVGEGLFTPSLLSDRDWSCIENNELPRRSFKMWKRILEFLPVPALLRLMRKLLALACSVNGVVSVQSKLSALWIRELATAVIKLHRVLDLVEEMNAGAGGGEEPTKAVKLAEGVSVSLKESDQLAKLSPGSLCSRLVARVEEEHPELKSALVLCVTTLPDSKFTYEIAKYAVLNPSRLTPIFLPSLLKLVDLPAPAETLSNLTTLVELYTQSVSVDVGEYADAPVYTVSNLTSSAANEVSATDTCERNDPTSKAIDVEAMEVEEADHSEQLEASDQQQNVSQSRWSVAEANKNWSKCPLGILPWQESKIWMDLILPDCTWQLSQGIEAVSIGKLPQLLHKEIEWEDVKKRRLKKKGNSRLTSKMIETALGIVSQNNAEI